MVSLTSRPARPRPGLPTLVAAFGVGIVALVLARATLMPDVGRWDTAEAQTVPPILGTMHPTGFPAYVVIGWVASILLGPLGSPAFVMNLLSALLLAVAAGASVVLGRLLTGSLALGIATGLGAALTPLVWRIGVRADVHALHLALMGLLLVALVAWEGRVAAGERAVVAGAGAVAPSTVADRWLLVAAVLYGLALADHRLSILFAPGIATYVLLVDRTLLRRRRFLAQVVGVSIAVAAAFYLLLPIRAGLLPAALVYGHPDTPIGFLQVVLGTQFGGEVAGPLGDLGGKVAGLTGLVVEQVGPLAPLVALGFVVTLVRRPPYAVLTGSATILTWLFAASYENADIVRYYAVPGLVAWTWLAITMEVAVDLVLRVARRPPAWAGRALRVGAAALLVAPMLLAVPARWPSVDASGDTVGRRWLEAALAALPEDAVVVSWWSYSTPLWYAQHIEGRRADLWVVDDRTRIDEDLGGVVDVIDANLGKRPVYLIRYEATELAMLTGRYRLTYIDLPAGQGLLRVDGPRSIQ
jgi:hypothetical protein